MRRSVAAALGAAAIVLALAVSPGAASAQFPGMPGVRRGWSPQIGGRAGWLFKDQSPSIGAVLVLPIPIPLLGPTLVGGGDLIFQDGLRERMGTLDLQVNALPGLFVGGGPAVMNTFFGTATTRETKTGFSLVVGLRARGRRVTNTIEARKLLVDSRKPFMFSFGLSYPLLGLLGG